MSSFNKMKLVESLRALSNEHRIAFAASCCERLIPNYDAFSSIEKWGNPKILRNALDQIWAFAEGIRLGKDEINSLISSCESVMPDTEDFGSVFTGLAMNSTASVMHTLRYCADSDLEDVVAVVSLAIESVENYLAVANDPNIGIHGADKKFDEWLKHAPLLISELDNQQQDIELLKAWRGENSELVSKLQQSSRTKGIQPFARGILKNRKGSSVY